MEPRAARRRHRRRQTDRARCRCAEPAGAEILSAAEPAVLTPHPGEAARLLATDIPAIVSRPLRGRARARRALRRRRRAERRRHASIAHPAGPLAVCPWGNPGMATGGMGDVLTGVIAALLAQGLQCVGRARAAAWRCMRAPAIAAARDAKRGLVASDLFPHLHELRNARARR